MVLNMGTVLQVGDGVAHIYGLVKHRSKLVSQIRFRSSN